MSVENCFLWEREGCLGEYSFFRRGLRLISLLYFFFFLIRNGKYLDDLGLYQAFNLTNMIIYVTLFLCKKIRDSRVFKFLDSSKHASLELKIVINLRGRIFNQRYLVISNRQSEDRKACTKITSVKKKLTREFPFSS